MNKIICALLIVVLIPAFAAIASEAEFLGWTSAVIQCGKDTGSR